MKIIVIGAVAAGTTAATKARRNMKDAEIVVYDMDEHISYSACGLPYYLGGIVDNASSLAPRGVDFFKSAHNIDVHIKHEVLSIDRANKSVTVKNLTTQEVFTDNYDKLVIATGASPFKPDMKGIERDNVFFLRTVNDAIKIKNFVDNHKPKNAVIVGAGFIGLEVLENFVHIGINTHIVQRGNKLTPNLDSDMADLIDDIIIKKGVKLHKNATVTEVVDGYAILADGTKLEADIVILSIGVRPNITLAQNAGIEIGITGAIKTDNKMATNDENIYSCGDCAEVFSAVTNKPMYRPLGTTANKAGRIAGDNLSGGSSVYTGSLSSSIFQLFELTVASTGISESEAIAEGFDVVVSKTEQYSKPKYIGGKPMTIKAVAEKSTGRLLGVQIVGEDGVDKRIDVLATLITYKVPVSEFDNIDLAYAPPYSNVKDAVHYVGMILEKMVDK